MFDDVTDDFETFELNQLAADHEDADDDDLGEADDTELGVVAALTAARAAHAEALVAPQGTPQRTAYALHAAAERAEDDGCETGLALASSAAYALRGDAGPMGVEEWARQALQPSDRVPAYERHVRLYVGRLGCDVHGCTGTAKVLLVLPRGASGFRCVGHLREVYASLPKGTFTVGIADNRGAGIGEAWDTREERAIEHERGAYESLSARGVL